MASDSFDGDGCFTFIVLFALLGLIFRTCNMHDTIDDLHDELKLQKTMHEIELKKLDSIQIELKQIKK